MLVGILAHYTWIAVEVAEVRRLRVENLALAAKARAYEENAGQLQAKVLQLQSVVTKLGLMAGVEERVPDESVGGVGGLSRAETLPPSVDIASTLKSLDSTVSELSDKSKHLESYFRTRRSCSPRRPRSGRCAATSRRASATGSTPSRACATSTPGSTSRCPAAPRSWLPPTASSSSAARDPATATR